MPTTTSSSSVFAAVRRLSMELDLAACAGDPRLAGIAHGRAVALGLHRHPLLASSLVSAYGRLGLSSLSRLLAFSSSHIEPTNLLLSNALLAALSRCGLFHDALCLFSHLRRSQSPDQFALAIASKASAEVADLRIGRILHSITTHLGFGSDTVLSNSLMLVYFRCGCPGDARQLFDEMPTRSVASWNGLISEYVNLGIGLSEGEVRKLMLRMQSEGLKPDGFTVSTVLPLCGAYLGSRLCGREIHGFVVRNSLCWGSDFHVGSCLIAMYSKGRRVDLGRQVFDRMGSRNVVTWTAMIAGYVENGEFREALGLFREMQETDGIIPNKVTLVSLLPAIGSLASLAQGKQIHGYAIRADLKEEVSLNNALINMYSKCGSLDCARRVFDDESWHRDAISWSSIILCYGVHGQGDEAVVLFNEMCNLGIKPDHITGLTVLSACCNAGLVAEGLDIYNSLTRKHGVLPTVEMCSCVVDMLGRAGQLSRALDFISTMAMPPGPSVWGALLGASVIHNNHEMQYLAYGFLLQSEPENPSNYVSLSNLHASSERWDIVAQVRTRMKERGLRKLPGCSLVNVNSLGHSSDF